jgi:pimeloyl-ACP methyl ester carboxylesterase
MINRNHPTWSVRSALRQFYEVYAYNPRMVTEDMLDEPELILKSERDQIAHKKMENKSIKQFFYADLARQRAETHKWLLDLGLHCPTLVVWGYRDPGAIFELGKQLIEMYMKNQRKTEVVVFNRSGHYVFREYAAQFNRALHGFVLANN